MQPRYEQKRADVSRGVCRTIHECRKSAFVGRQSFDGHFAPLDVRWNHMRVGPWSEPTSEQVHCREFVESMGARHGTSCRVML